MYICHHVGGDSDICDLELITPIKFCGNQASCFHQVVLTSKQDSYIYEGNRQTEQNKKYVSPLYSERHKNPESL